jgi:hypothetical protein
MLKKAYIVIVNALLFFFIVSIVNGVVINAGNVWTKTVIGVLFGLLMLIVPNLLQFFKISVNMWSRLLLSIVLAFVFFFVLYSGIGGLASFGPTLIDVGLGGALIKIADGLGTLVFVTLVTALGSVGIHRLSQG